MNRSLIVVMVAVALNAAGVGLTMPILPALLRDVGHQGDLGWRYGAFLGLYALMQFLVSPLLGALSDRWGRRPVLMLSLAGAAVDYLFMAFAPTLPLLFVGRAISGVTNASMAVATAYVADIAPEGQRTRRFGQLSACFGLGFIAGPAIGGLLGAVWVRAPFMAAAALSGANLLLAAVALRETRPDVRSSTTEAAVSFNPLEPLRWVFGFPALAPLIGAFLVLALVGEVGGVIWVLYGEDRFGWGPISIGVSLAGFGVFHALAQAFVAGPLAERWGERRTMLVGVLADSAAYVSIALASRGWMAFMLLPLFCLGGIGAPAVQSLLSAQVDESRQGRLQGVLASLTSLVSAVGPLAISAGYFATRDRLPGMVWIAGAALYLLCLPVLLGGVSREASRA